MLDSLTLDQLRILIAINETGSFSEAARRLGRGQSAISQSVHSLEDTLGIRLFDRTGRLPVLTAAGEAVIQNARHVLQSIESLRLVAHNLSTNTEPELTIAVDVSFPNAVLMSSLMALRSVFPTLPVTLITDIPHGVEAHLLEGRARIAIYPFDLTDNKDLAHDFLTSVLNVPVVSIDHPLAQERGPIKPNRLAAYNLLRLTSRRIRSPINLHQQAWTFASQLMRLEYLLAGFGWCMMPNHMVLPYLESGRLKKLQLAETTEQTVLLHAVYEAKRPPGRAGRWLLDDLRKRLGSIY